MQKYIDLCKFVHAAGTIRPDDDVRSRYSMLLEPSEATTLALPPVVIDFAKAKSPSEVRAIDTVRTPVRDDKFELVLGDREVGYLVASITGAPVLENVTLSSTRQGVAPSATNENI